MLRRIKHCQVHYVGRAKNQEADALASECLKEVTVGAVKLQESKLQGSLVPPRCIVFSRDRRTTATFHPRRKKMAGKKGSKISTH